MPRKPFVFNGCQKWWGAYALHIRRPAAVLMQDGNCGGFTPFINSFHRVFHRFSCRAAAQTLMTHKLSTLSTGYQQDEIIHFPRLWITPDLTEFVQHRLCGGRRARDMHE